MKSNIVFLVFGILLIAVGSVVSAIELMEYDFIDSPYYGDVYSIKNGERSISLNDVKCFVIDTSNDFRDIRKSFVYDQSIEDEIIIKYDYIDKLYNLNVNIEASSDDCMKIDANYKFTAFDSNIRDFARVVFDNLKNKKIYNYYKKFNSEITIVINPKYKDRIVIE